MYRAGRVSVRWCTVQTAKTKVHRAEVVEIIVEDVTWGHPHTLSAKQPQVGGLTSHARLAGADSREHQHTIYYSQKAERKEQQLP